MTKILLVAFLLLPPAISTMAVAGTISLGSITLTESALCNCQQGLGPLNQPGPGTVSFNNPAQFGGGTSSATIISSSSGGLSLIATANGSTRADAEASFLLEILGPQNINVLLDISGFTGITLANPVIGFGAPDAVASFSLRDLVFPNSFLFAACSGVTFNGQIIPDLGTECTSANVRVGAGSFSQAVLVPTNHQISVSLVVDANSDDTGSVHGTLASAQIDPFFQLDPTFAASNPGYSLNFSSGFNNVPGASSVPEPSFSWLVFCALAAGMWNRTRRLTTRD